MRGNAEGIHPHFGEGQRAIPRRRHSVHVHGGSHRTRALSNISDRLITPDLVVGQERRHDRDTAGIQGFLQRVKLHHGFMIDGHLPPLHTLLIDQPANRIKSRVMLRSSGGNHRWGVRTLLALVFPHTALQSRVDRLSATGGKNHFGGMCSHHSGNPLAGTLQQCSRRAPTAVEGAGVTRNPESLKVGLFDSLRHGACCLVVQIDAHGPRT